jgi:Flp pilus assembly protein CpaB
MALIFVGVLALPMRGSPTGVVQPPPEPVPAMPTPRPRTGAMPETEIASIVVASFSMPAQTMLTKENTRETYVTPEARQPNAATSQQAVIGQVLIVPVAAGEQILMPRIAIRPWARYSSQSNPRCPDEWHDWRP